MSNGKLQVIPLDEQSRKDGVKGFEGSKGDGRHM